jgi:5-dehydro-2-deoxygluconokinase
MAGFLRGWLRAAPLERCCELANAAGAIVVSRHGCAPAMPSWRELESFLARAERPIRLRDDAALEQIHWADGRPPAPDSLAVLAIDHRTWFVDLACELGVSVERTEGFKMLAVAAVDRVARKDRCFGLLLDGRFGGEALARSADLPYWIARPIEAPGSRPLSFEGSPDVGCELATWPVTQIVKCLVTYHPDDAPDLRARQDRQLLRLFDACRHTGHELLLEVIMPAQMARDAATAARALRCIYAAGVRPDWWKLEPTADALAWRAIAEAIEEADPDCRGVLILGLSAPPQELAAAFAAAAGEPIVKGFAVGRTIFDKVARRWFVGEIDDEAATAALAQRFERLVGAWRAARGAAERAA